MDSDNRRKKGRIIKREKDLKCKELGDLKKKIILEKRKTMLRRRKKERPAPGAVTEKGQGTTEVEDKVRESVEEEGAEPGGGTNKERTGDRGGDRTTT